MKRARETKQSKPLFVHLKPKQTSQPINAEHWSESSKCSSVFSVHPAQYEDIHYLCAKCGQSAVFTAIDQKLAYEVHKAYIWQRRKLCSKCWGEMQQIQRGIRNCQARWREHKQQLKQDIEFLRRWLGLLEAYPTYGGRPNPAAVVMLQRLMKAAA